MEELYDRYYRELLRYAAAACWNQAEAEDIVQETFLRALQNMDLLETLGGSQKRAWLYRTLKNTLCDRFRRAKLEEAYILGIPPEESYLDPGIQKTENRILLGQLSREDRALFHLRYEEGYNASELAELFGIPAGTVRARLFRCRKLLQTMMEE